MKKFIGFAISIILLFNLFTIMFSSQKEMEAPIELPTFQMEMVEVIDNKPIRVLNTSMSEKSFVTLDETEKLIFATLVAYECGGSSYETKLAVASVVVNRMKMWNSSLRAVVYATNQFSPAKLINPDTGSNEYWAYNKNTKKYDIRKTKDMTHGGPYEECWKAVEEVCKHGPTIPSYVFYFRSGHYHTRKTFTNYAKIGPMYFSYAPKYTKVCSHCNERFTKTEFPDHQKSCM